MSRWRSLLVVLAFLTPAAGQEHVPLGDLPTVEGLETPTQGHVYSRARRLAERIPGLQGFQAPTVGTLRLGVVLVEFADRPRPWFGAKAGWEQMFFAPNYAKTATGDAAFGSLADFYRENSGGRLEVTGRVFDWIKLPLKRRVLEGRPGFGPGSNNALVVPALDALLARDGQDALSEVDVLVFVAAGGWAGRRGGLLWPHASLVRYGGRIFNYYLMSSGLKWFEAVGVHCHELGHTLGILDKYGVGQRTGLGQWCAMSTGAHGGRAKGVSLDTPTSTPEETARRVALEQVQAGLEWLTKILEPPPPPRAPVAPKGPRVHRPEPTKPVPRPVDGEERPLHFCAVCKVRLGWSQATAIDPRQTTRLVLTPVEQDVDQVARVILDPRGRESLYLEYRAPVGFDASLPRGGLLVWRVGSPSAAARTFVPFERCELIPAHGQASTDAALRAPAQVPFPAGEIDSLTVGGTRPGAWTVKLSGIRVADGKLYVEIGPVE